MFTIHTFGPCDDATYQEEHVLMHIDTYYIAIGTSWTIVLHNFWDLVGISGDIRWCHISYTTTTSGGHRFETANIYTSCTHSVFSGLSKHVTVIPKLVTHTGDVGAWLGFMQDQITTDVLVDTWLLINC